MNQQVNNSKRNQSEKQISKAQIPEVIQELKLIENKRSKLSAYLRKTIYFRLKYLVAEGFLSCEEKLFVCSHPFFDFNKCPFLSEGADCSNCEFVDKEYIRKSPVNDKK